jgi:hypothetical protein
MSDRLTEFEEVWNEMESVVGSNLMNSRQKFILMISLFDDVLEQYLDKLIFWRWVSALLFVTLVSQWVPYVPGS